jgi:tRNA threonylcarbamoyl adenosine modification protein YeaZ/ribosomal-protein-alanine acetyltransferase
MLLALDSCFNACSVALHDEARGVIASRYQEMERGQAEMLGLMVQAVLDDVGLSPSSLALIAATRGPGTFTGLRIGLSYAKGMALALGVPLLGVDSLQATAAPHLGAGPPVLVAQKAGGSGLCYWSVFDGAKQTPPALAAPHDILAALPVVPHAVVGSAAETMIELRRDLLLLEPPWPDAKAFAAMTANMPVTDDPVEPLYLRAPDAKPSVASAASQARVRIAVAKDFADMANLHASCFDEGWSKESLHASLSLPGAGALVVQLGGATYGFVQFQCAADEAEIHTICVSPNHRRQHFAMDLMQALLKRLHQQKISRVFLEVAAGNFPALALYERSGFKRTGQRKGYYSNGSDAITMALDLAV